MSSTMRKTKRNPAVRRLTAAAVALGSCLALAGPAGSADAAPTEPVPTVFFGDSYTANFGIAPLNQDDDKRLLCFQSKENYPAVAIRRLKDKGITLDVQADVSCGGASAHHFWEEQKVPLSDTWLPPQQDTLSWNTELAVGSMGGNTLGFSRILAQCSDKLRKFPLLPGDPVNGEVPAAQCGEFFESGDGKQWLDDQFEQTEWELTELLERIHDRAPGATPVLVGYPRLVPKDTKKCLTPAPGQKELPLADIPQDALPVLDRIQKRLNDVMKKTAADVEGGADFVDLYARTGGNTACDGANRGTGGLLEESPIGFPWLGHPSEKGRDIQAAQVATKIEEVLNR